MVVAILRITMGVTGLRLGSGPLVRGCEVFIRSRVGRG